jgi:hypothetical protein
VFYSPIQVLPGYGFIQTLRDATQFQTHEILEKVKSKWNIKTFETRSKFFLAGMKEK